MYSNRETWAAVSQKRGCLEGHDLGTLRFGKYSVRKTRFETIRGSLMTPKWQKLASLAQEICTL